MIGGGRAFGGKGKGGKGKGWGVDAVSRHIGQDGEEPRGMDFVEYR